MKCPQLLNSLVLLQFVIVSSSASDEEIDKRRKFDETFFFSPFLVFVLLERCDGKKEKKISEIFISYACLLKIPLWKWYATDDDDDDDVIMSVNESDQCRDMLERWKLKCALKIVFELRDSPSDRKSGLVTFMCALRLLSLLPFCFA